MLYGGCDMSRRLVGFLTIFCAVISIVLTCYPVGRTVVRNWRSIKAVEWYEDAIEEMDEDSRCRLWNLARWYNFCLRENIHQEDIAECYEKILNVDQGIMGYVEVSGKYWRLPIRYSKQQDGEKYGLTHLMGSALPVGGKGNHTILTGQGMIAHIKEEDMIHIHIAGKILSYRVEKIQHVTPGDTTGILPTQGEDRCTLLTTIPNGAERKKILIHGIRCEEVYMDMTGMGAENLPAACAAYSILVLFLPLATGGIGSAMRRIVRKWNWCRLTNRA